MRRSNGSMGNLLDIKNRSRKPDLVLLKKPWSCSRSREGSSNESSQAKKNSLQDEMMDMMDISNEIQESLGRSYSMPDDIDEDDLMGELDALEATWGWKLKVKGCLHFSKRTCWQLAELTIRVWMNLVYLPSLMHHLAVKFKKLGAIIWLSSQVGGSCGLIVRLFVIWMDDTDGGSDSILKHKPIWAYNPKSQRKNKSKTVQKKQGDLHRTYGTRVVPVFVLSLADVDPHLMMTMKAFFGQVMMLLLYLSIKVKRYL